MKEYLTHGVNNLNDQLSHKNYFNHKKLAHYFSSAERKEMPIYDSISRKIFRNEEEIMALSEKETKRTCYLQT